MESRPRTISQRKRIARRKLKLRSDKRQQLGIPPKAKGWMGKFKIGW
ncbi:MAG: hypothetical protein K2W96_02675 [Gemmataceae bacterium]|nr:hypothetical protein [Gemmataceae bacterium]